IGVDKMIISSKVHLTFIQFYKNTLEDEKIHYPEEVRAVEDVPNVPEKTEVVKKELDTAKLLIYQLTTDFDPEKYTDEYRNALLELIEQKKAGETVTAPQKEKKPDNVTNLMDALQASLDKANKDNDHADKKKTTKKSAKKVAK